MDDMLEIARQAFPHTMTLGDLLGSIPDSEEFAAGIYDTLELKTVIGAATELCAMATALVLEDKLDDRVRSLITATFLLGMQVGRRQGLTLVVASSPAENTQETPDEHL